MGGCFSFPLGFRFAFPFLLPSLSFPLWSREGSGKEKRGMTATGGRKTLPKATFWRHSRFQRISKSPFRSHCCAQSTARGDTPKMPFFPPLLPCPQMTKHDEERELGGRQRRRRCREAPLPPRALPAVSNHAPQGSEPAQIPNYFLLQCRAWSLDGVPPALAGEGKKKTSALVPTRCCRQSKGRVEVGGKRVPRLRNEEWFVQKQEGLGLW